MGDDPDEISGHIPDEVSEQIQDEIGSEIHEEVEESMEVARGSPEKRRDPQEIKIDDGKTLVKKGTGGFESDFDKAS